MIVTEHMSDTNARSTLQTVNFVSKAVTRV